MPNDQTKEQTLPVEPVEKGESAKVAENAGNFNNHLQNQNGLILAAAISKGKWRKLFDGKKDKKAIQSEWLARLEARNPAKRREKLRNLTEQLKNRGVDALELLLEPNGTVIPIIKSELQRFPELEKMLTNIFETESAKGLEGALKVVNVIPALYHQEGVGQGSEAIRKMSHEAVKKHPELLKAIDKIMQFDLDEYDKHVALGGLNDYNHRAYLELAGSAVTGVGFKWEDLNLQRLTPKLGIGFTEDMTTFRGEAVDFIKDIFDTYAKMLSFDINVRHKHLNFKEQMTVLVSAAKDAAKTNSKVTLPPKKFDEFTNSKAREKLSKQIKKLRSIPDSDNKYVMGSLFNAIAKTDFKQKAR